MSQLSAAVRAVFERLLSASTEGGIAQARERVQDHLAQLRLAARRNPLLAIDVAEAVASGLEQLLDAAGEMSPGGRALVIAASWYFASETDAVRDTSGVLGLDDDQAVFNHVVDRLGLSNRKLNL